MAIQSETHGVGGGGGGVNLLASITSTASGTSTDSWVTIPDFSAAVTIAATSSVIMLIANVQIDAVGSDDTAEFQFADDGGQEGPIIHVFQDNTNEGTGLSGFTWLKTGISGSHTFTLKYRSVDGKDGSLDTARTRSFQVVEFLN